MQRPPPILLPLLRSPLQGELLAWLFLHPDHEFPQMDLAYLFGVSAAGVSREVDRLSEAGLVHHRRLGNLRLVRAATETAVARPLTELLALTYGPIAVLPEMLTGVPGVEEAYIYGSWAARYQGEPGPVPHDLDVLVIGGADLDDLDDVARKARQRLGREVNIRQITRGDWESPEENPFLESVRTRPRVKLEVGAG
ncbi:hypothetical protein [Herbidospora sp. RD11066]